MYGCEVAELLDIVVGLDEVLLLVLGIIHTAGDVFKHRSPGLGCHCSVVDKLLHQRCSLKLGAVACCCSHSSDLGLVLAVLGRQGVQCQLVGILECPVDGLAQIFDTGQLGELARLARHGHTDIVACQIHTLAAAQVHGIIGKLASMCQKVFLIGLSQAGLVLERRLAHLCNAHGDEKKSKKVSKFYLALLGLETGIAKSASSPDPEG